jgi:hypothetical protein
VGPSKRAGHQNKCSSKLRRIEGKEVRFLLNLPLYISAKANMGFIVVPIDEWVSATVQRTGGYMTIACPIWRIV